MATMEGYMTKRGRVRKVGFVWLQLRARFCYFVAHNVDCSAAPTSTELVATMVCLDWASLNLLRRQGWQEEGRGVCVCVHT